MAHAYENTSKAISLVHGTSDLEQALIHSLKHRYPEKESNGDPMTWVKQYASEMRKIYNQFPEDPDVVTLTAEALMNPTPWELWDLKTGEIADGANTAEAMIMLEGALNRIDGTDQEKHPGLLHMYIHLMELSLIHI